MTQLPSGPFERLGDADAPVLRHEVIVEYLAPELLVTQ
jgi:hypothetical protein